MALVVAIAPMGAWADDLQTAREVVSVIQKAVTSGRLQRVVAELSAPLVYDSSTNPLHPANLQDPRNLDVSGVRLGMSPSDVAAALRAAGFKQDIDGAHQRSYDTQVRAAWQSNTNTDTGPPILVDKSARWIKSGQKILVDYVAMPDGARVEWITYEAEPELVSEAAFEAQLLRKYGEQVNGEATDQRWCTVKAPTCEDPRSSEFPVLEASPARRTIWLSGYDVERKVALEERFKADVAKRGPKQVEPSF